MTDAALRNGFYIVLVGSNTEAEPVRIQDGKWYSCGCEDPHELSGVEILHVLEIAGEGARTRHYDPRTPEERERDYQKSRQEHEKRTGRKPGHRRWS